MRALFTFLIAFVVASGVAWAAADLPSPDGFVTDTANFLSSETETALETKLTDYKNTTGTEIAVLTVPLLPPDTDANTYATAVGNAWGIGQKGADNGVLFLIETDDAPGQKDVYIATGSQAEGALTDVRAHAIVDEIVIPHFKTGDADGGVTAGVDAIIAALAGEKFAGATVADSSSADGLSDNAVNVIIFIGIILLQILAAMLGRSKNIWPGGLIGFLLGGVVGLIFGGLVLSIVAAVVVGLLGLFFDWLVSNSGGGFSGGGSSGGGWSGGSSGSSGSSSGGSFGGFSGGGFSGGGGGSKW